MKFPFHRFRARSPLTRLLAALALLAGALGISVLSATVASADASVHTLVAAPVSYAPSQSDLAGGIAANVYFDISCYATGDSVTGPYGSENTWDLISSKPNSNVGYGYFVPDADVYTGSNSPVVPPCSVPFVTAIGSSPVEVLSGPGDEFAQDSPLNPGEQVVLQCYTTSTTWVTGPYGSENIWDMLIANWQGPEWVPDALIYTGSNSAVVPHC